MHLHIYVLEIVIGVEGLEGKVTKMVYYGLLSVPIRVRERDKIIFSAARGRRLYRSKIA